MFADRNLCGWCPQPSNNLEFLEARFQNGLCFLELECRHCARRWTAEVSMPADEDFALAMRHPDHSPPSWRLVEIVPARLHAAV